MVTLHKWNIAYQMNPLSSGHNRSSLPETVGHLVAAIQQNVVGKTLTNIMKGKAVNPSFVWYRLFIHKVSGAVLVELQVDRPANMGGPSLLVNAKLHGSGQITKKSLCHSIDRPIVTYFMDKASTLKCVVN